MVGVITGRDILAHPVVTIRCFGWQVFFKAVAPWQGRTFLSLLQSAAFPRAATSNVRDYLPRLEQQMDAAEAGVREISSNDAALQLVIQIESSEINEVFHAALAATDAAFVKRLKPFRKAMEAHVSYIVERIPQLSPRLMLTTRELRARFPRVMTTPSRKGMMPIGLASMPTRTRIPLRRSNVPHRMRIVAGPTGK